MPRRITPNQQPAELPKPQTKLISATQTPPQQSAHTGNNPREPSEPSKSFHAEQSSTQSSTRNPHPLGLTSAASGSLRASHGKGGDGEAERAVSLQRRRRRNPAPSLSLLSTSEVDTLSLSRRSLSRTSSLSLEREIKRR